MINDGGKFIRKGLKRASVKSWTKSIKSKFEMYLRMFLISSFCIYIPLFTVLYSYLQKVEENHLLNYTETKDTIASNNIFYYISLTIFRLLANKSTILFYSSFIYINIHPFLAVKIVIVTAGVHYFNLILNSIYESIRPFWNMTQHEGNKFCMLNFSNPSEEFFIFSFYFFYIFIILKGYFYDTKSLSKTTNIILTGIYLFLCFIIGSFLFLNRLNYIYQIVFTLTMSIISIVISIEMDVYIHKYILHVVKNLKNCRRSKMRILIYSFLFMFIAILCFMFTPDPDLNKIEDNLIYNKKCKDRIFLIEDIIGTKESFNDSAYMWSIAGATWGIGLTIEKNLGIWWSSQGFSFCRKRKIIFSFIFGAILCVPMFLINLPNYEMNFVLLCFAYFLYPFIMMGILPIIFYAFGWNYISEKNEDENESGIKFLNNNVNTGNQFLIPKTILGINDPEALGLSDEIEHIGPLTDEISEK